MSKPDKTLDPKILDAAKKEFLEKGFMKASLRSICKKAGVTTGALYFFFEDKDDLFASLVQEPLAGVREAMERHFLGEKQAMEALERVGLKERAHHLPGQLSGGEQQRVCIARALINCPKLILADEPTGNLDEKNEKIVLDLFRQLHEQGTTIIVVTHDALVASCAQREIMLNHGVLVGEKWNDEAARKAYEQAGGKPAYTGSTTEGAQNGETAISFADPTKAAKTGGEE